MEWRLDSLAVGQPRKRLHSVCVCEMRHKRAEEKAEDEEKLERSAVVR